MKFLRITTTLLLLLMFAVIHALEPGKATYQYHLDTWKRERGLPENTITCIKQTGKGYIWLGTPMGLVRFDGVHFKLYDKKTVPAFLNNFVRTIHEDHDGNLWIGTEGGLLKFEKGRFTPFTLGEKKADNFVMTICETPGGSLWIGTLSGSVYCFQKGEFTRYSSKSGLSGGAVRCLHFSRTGILRAGTANGLYRYRDGKFVSSPLAKEISADYITCIYEDVEKKQLWIGTTEGLNRVNEESGKVKIYTAAQGLTGNIVLDIYRDRDDNLWLGTEGGLCRITGDVLTAFSGPQSLPRNVYSISEDTEGGLWLGTLGGGLFRLRDVPITAYTTSGGLSHNMVSGIIEDNRNNIWLGTAGGLNRFTDGAFYQYTIKDGLSDNSISSLRMDSSGRLWIGTRKGLNRFSNGAFVSYTTRNGLSDDKITAILEDSAKTFWIGTYE
ncbi:MAG: hypothetical protein GY765_31620, partial [bacterium]|nr:hypothetical protein [bacterium]